MISLNGNIAFSFMFYWMNLVGYIFWIWHLVPFLQLQQLLYAVRQASKTNVKYYVNYTLQNRAMVKHLSSS